MQPSTIFVHDNFPEEKVTAQVAEFKLITDRTWTDKLKNPICRRKMQFADRKNFRY